MISNTVCNTHSHTQPLKCKIIKILIFLIYNLFPRYSLVIAGPVPNPASTS